MFLCSCGHLSQWKGLTCKSMCFTHTGWLIPPLVSSIGWALLRICVFLLSSQYKTWGGLRKLLFSWTVACLTLLPSSSWCFHVMCRNIIFFLQNYFTNKLIFKIIPVDYGLLRLLSSKTLHAAFNWSSRKGSLSSCQDKGGAEEWRFNTFAKLLGASTCLQEWLPSCSCRSGVSAIEILQHCCCFQA